MTDVGYANDQGKTAALVVWLLYIVSVPSVGVLLPAGLILAYVARGDAAPWVRDHFAKQIKVGWTAAIWYAIAWGVFGLGMVTAVILIGFPLMGLSWLIGAVLALWLIVVSALGFLRVLNERPA